MELMQLEMFVAMVEEGNFHRAAERVFRTQPALSMALRKLEAEIGAPLFDRSNRSAYTLTDAGDLLYGQARRLLRLRDETLASIEKLRSYQSGAVRIGANESTSLYLLPKLLRSFHAQYPSLEIEIIRKLSRLLPDELRQRNIDFGVLSFKPKDGDLEARSLMQDEIVLIVSPQDRLASLGRVHITDLGSTQFIAHNVRSLAVKKVADAFHKHRTPLNVKMRSDAIEGIKKFVAMNMGAGFVPLMCVADEAKRGEVVVVPLDGFRHQRTLWLVHRRTDAHSYAARAFMQAAASTADWLNGEIGKTVLPEDRARDGASCAVS